MIPLDFIRESSARMYAHWTDENFGWTVSPTAEFFADNIDRGNFEFWTAQSDGRLLCELYLVRALDEDPDFVAHLKDACVGEEIDRSGDGLTAQPQVFPQDRIGREPIPGTHLPVMDQRHQRVPCELDLSRQCFVKRGHSLLVYCFLYTPLLIK